MITISGVTISNPSGDKAQVVIDIFDSLMNKLETLLYINYPSGIIQYDEPSGGTYYIKITDGTSTEGCELLKSINASTFYSCVANFDLGYYDSYFNTGANLNEYGGLTIVDYNGTYMVGGTFSSYSSNSVNNLAKINYDGTQYMPFSTTAYTTNVIEKIIPITGGSNLLFGSISGGKPIIKINPNGSIDGTFNLQYQLNFLNDGDIIKVDNNFILGGNDRNDNMPQRIVRILPNGNFDSTFNNGGVGFATNGYINSLYYDTINSKILVGGNYFSTYNGTSLSNSIFIRLNLDGTLDTSFTPSLTGTTVRSITMYNSSYIVVGDDCIYKISSDGTIDTSFNSGGTGFVGNGVLRKVIVDSNNKIMCVGSFTTYNGSSFGGIVRLNSNGDIDTSFNNGGIGFQYASPRDIIEDEYNRYVVVGGFQYYNNQNFTSNSNYTTGMVRLNQDGSLNM